MKYLNDTIKLLLLLLVAGFTSCKDDSDGNLDPWLSLTNELGNVFPAEIETDFLGGEFIMNIYTNTEWTMTSTADWVRIEPAGRIGCVTGKIVVATSDVTSPREAVVTLKSNDPALRTYTINVKQGATPSYVLIKDFHILPEATGDASGSDWDNAMGPEELRDLLTNAFDTKGRSITLGEGTFKLHPDLVIKKHIDIIKGAGRDKTILTVSDTPGAVTQMFNLQGGANISFEGVTFDGGYTSVNTRGCLRAFNFNATGVDELHLTDCRVRNFNITAADNYVNGRGAIIQYTGPGKTYFRNSIFENCASQSNGNITNTADPENSFVFCDGCTFAGNRITGDWGVVFHSDSPVMLNNCTFVDNYSTKGGAYPINIMCDMLMVNTTMYESKEANNKAQLRIANLGKAGTAWIANSVFLSTDNKPSVILDENSPAVSVGHNVWNSVTGINLLTTAGTESAVSGDCGASFDAAIGLVSWTLPAEINAFAKTGDISAAIKRYNSNKHSGVGEQFSLWLGGNETRDAKGTSRPGDKMTPGALQL